MVNRRSKIRSKEDTKLFNIAVYLNLSAGALALLIVILIYLGYSGYLGQTVYLNISKDAYNLASSNLAQIGKIYGVNKINSSIVTQYLYAILQGISIIAIIQVFASIYYILLERKAKQGNQRFYRYASIALIVIGVLGLFYEFPINMLSVLGGIIGLYGSKKK
ncbi:MAG: hypothetical protein ARM1_0390 [Candidatus Micrarchaeota archaeon]|nr:MAG: hypothetical protein ARM1_0390 [Candidatus Micrarchaeota archaeon]